MSAAAEIPQDQHDRQSSAESVLKGSIRIKLNGLEIRKADNDSSDHKKCKGDRGKPADLPGFDFAEIKMKSTGVPTTNTVLKVFTGRAGDGPECYSNVVARQLPFLPDLSQNFESVTGWKLSFFESNRDFTERIAADVDMPVIGRLQISDMSESLEIGKSARHRGLCDRLAGILDQMVRRIQTDAGHIQNIDRRLNGVVDVPFEWWGLAGKTGFHNGRFSAWSISIDEKIRTVAGQLEADGAVDSAICSATVLAAFETACRTSVELHEIAPLLSSVIQKAANSNGRFNWFATTELDPITGDFATHGFNSAKGSALIDIGASTVLETPDGEYANTLYSGQILAIGVTRQQRQELNEILTNTEMTIHEFSRIVEQKFNHSASLFLYRK